MNNNNKEIMNEISVVITDNDDSPKIDPLISKDFKDVNLITNDNISEDNNINRAPTADLVNVIIDDINRNSGTIVINKDDNKQISSELSLNKRIEDLLLIIKKNKNDIINNLYIISSKYDVLYYRYNNISLAILVLSTIITFVEAIRLTLVNYDTTYKDSKISLVISSETISLIINILSLSLSTILTVLSSIAKFKNYKENMDKLKNIHDELFSYKNMYDKQKQLILFFKTSNNMNEDIYKEIHQTIEGYNREIKAISIFENIRNTDIIKFHKIKAEQDVKLKKILEEREVKLLRINTLSKNKKENIGNEKPNCCTNLIPL
jgi:hypothetical protein